MLIRYREEEVNKNINSFLKSFLKYNGIKASQLVENKSEIGCPIQILLPNASYKKQEQIMNDWNERSDESGFVSSIVKIDLYNERLAIKLYILQHTGGFLKQVNILRAEERQANLLGSMSLFSKESQNSSDFLDEKNESCNDLIKMQKFLNKIGVNVSSIEFKSQADEKFICIPFPKKHFIDSSEKHQYYTDISNQWKENIIASDLPFFYYANLDSTQRKDLNIKADAIDSRPILSIKLSRELSVSCSIEEFNVAAKKMDAVINTIENIKKYRAAISDGQFFPAVIGNLVADYAVGPSFNPKKR